MIFMLLACCTGIKQVLLSRHFHALNILNFIWMDRWVYAMKHSTPVLLFVILLHRQPLSVLKHMVEDIVTLKGYDTYEWFFLLRLHTLSSMAFWCIECGWDSSLTPWTHSLFVSNYTKLGQICCSVFNNVMILCY